MIRADIWNLDRVTLARPVWCDEGKEIPAGSKGTVVGIWAKGSAFEVEFTQPFDALATVCACDIYIRDSSMNTLSIVEASNASETLKRQLAELDRLQKARDYIAGNLPGLTIKAEIMNARADSRFFFEHERLEGVVRAKVSGVMDELVETQLAICKATHARLTEAMSIKPDLGEMLGQEPVSVATSVSVLDGFPYENKA